MGTGQVIAALSAASYFGFLFGPPVIGYIAEAANLRWSLAFVYLSEMMIFVFVSKIKIAK
jgi:MFS family permease